MKLYESRDVRSEANRKIADYSYQLSYQKSNVFQSESPNLSKLSVKISGPRLFKRKNVLDMELRDPKRIYSTLIEFNDPISKESYRKLLEVSSGAKDPKNAKVTQSVVIDPKKSQGKNDLMLENKFDDEAKKGFNPEDLKKSDEDVEKLEGEVEKIADHEGAVKGENIGKLFVENLEHIANTVAEYFFKTSYDK